jgi:hypothetical protein
MQRTSLGIALLAAGMLLVSACEKKEPSGEITPKSPESATRAKTASVKTQADLQDSDQPVSDATGAETSPKPRKSRFYQQPNLPATTSTTICELVLPDVTTSPFLTEDCFVLDWTIIGPVELNPARTELGSPAIEAELVPDEASLDGARAVAPELAWRKFRFTGDDALGRVDLRRRWGVAAPAAAYAATRIDCPERIENATLRLGNSDPVKVYLNGKEVHTAKRRDTSAWDQVVIENVTLKEGSNRLLVKCVDLGGGMDFYLRFTDANDRPLRIEQR